MSLVIAIRDKENNRVILGADKQGTVGGNRTHSAQKIWEVEGAPTANGERVLMGGVGLIRALQIMQYNPIPFDRNLLEENGAFTTAYLSTDFVELIVEYLTAKGITTSIEDEGQKMVASPNAYIIAQGDKAWMIGQDLSVEEVDDFIAIGSGADIARGVLRNTQGLHPFERIARAIEAASEETTSVDDFVEILATKDLPEDDEDFDEALGEDAYSLVAELMQRHGIDNIITIAQAIKDAADEIVAAQKKEGKSDDKPDSNTDSDSGDFDDSTRNLFNMADDDEFAD